MEMLAWSLIGALIGIAAANKKGFSMAAGIIGGLLLGPLALLMFFASGVTRGGTRRRCPFCQEWIQVAATVCPHCQRDQPGAAPAIDPQKRTAQRPSPAAMEQARPPRRG